MNECVDGGGRAWKQQRRIEVSGGQPEERKRRESVQNTPAGILTHNRTGEGSKQCAKQGVGWWMPVCPRVLSVTCVVGVRRCGETREEEVAQQREEITKLSWSEGVVEEEMVVSQGEKTENEPA